MKYKEFSQTKARAYDVYLRGKLVDTVWFTGYDEGEARKSLVNHDGYNSAIIVHDREARRQR